MANAVATDQQVGRIVQIIGPVLDIGSYWLVRREGPITDDGLAAAWRWFVQQLGGAAPAAG